MSIAVAIYFKPVSINNTPTTEINFIEEIKKQKHSIGELRDRGKDGICEPMYAEGFDWGVMQHEINWQTEHWQYPDYYTKEQRALAWYKFWEEIIK